MSESTIFLQHFLSYACYFRDNKGYLVKGLRERGYSGDYIDMPERAVVRDQVDLWKVRLLVVQRIEDLRRAVIGLSL
jgi:hypothetical protein